MDEFDYQLLQSLYEYKNITLTSKKIYLSQPALTNRIKKIEQELNTQLIIRSKNGIIFTTAGEKIIEYINKIQINLRDMKDFVTNMTDEVYGTLRLGIATIYAHYQLPPLLNGYLKKYPHVSLNIHVNNSNTVFNLLKANKVSIAIMHIDYNWSGNKILLYSEPVCLASQKKIPFNELNRLPYIKYSTSPSLQLELDKWLNENKIIESKNIIETNTIYTCAELIKNGIGWTVLLATALKGYNGYIEKLYWKNKSPFLRNTYLYFREEYIQLDTIRTFIDYITKHTKTADH